MQTFLTENVLEEVAARYSLTHESPLKIGEDAQDGIDVPVSDHLFHSRRVNIFRQIATPWSAATLLRTSQAASMLGLVQVRYIAGFSTRQTPGGFSQMQVLNPATEEVIAELPSARVEDMDRAVAAARSAFPAWQRVSATSRARLLRNLAGLIEERAEELALLETRNVGKPISDSRAEVAMVAEVFHFYAGAVDKHYGESIPVPGGIDLTFREALGVVGLITPWNFPLNIASWKVAPALACGNTVVLKPAELTPLTSMRLAELAVEAGIPEGVVNVVTGKGSVVGQHLLEHPDVAKIAFTGSTEVGRRVMETAAGSIKRVTLELGGKSANVIFADADLEAAAASAPYAVFGNAGQDCCARSRILVERSAFDDFLELLIKTTEQLVVGDPADSETEMGPLVSAEHREKVASFIDGEVAFQGSTPDGAGFWYPPTVLAPVSNDSRQAREEIFGPVAAVIPFEDENDAVDIANDTPYGLSGSIWTHDGARAMRVARGIDAGVLSINSNTSVRVQTPFGGFKQSGFGRELGMHALASYSEIKNVYMATEP
jgi:acyl-CoA reductase-like NAD-dependent aldehyde dehydrogenase